MNCSSCNSWY